MSVSSGQFVGGRNALAVACMFVLSTTSSWAAADMATDGAVVLKPETYQHYVTTFREQEKAATGGETSGTDASWTWMQKEIPWFDSSDKQFEEMYYFRWYAWRKHLVETRLGYVITEWLPKPEEKNGFFGALPDAAPFHIGEARWLRDKKIAEDDVKFWLSPEDSDSHKYSTPMAWTVQQLTLANGDAALSKDLLPAMKANYQRWETEQQDSNGLFWSIDTRDAMEKSISGDGYRPTLNSYLYGDAQAIAAIAGVAGDAPGQSEYAGKAKLLQALIETKLWNPKDEFYEVISPSADSGIRRQKKFIDSDPELKRINGFSGVREQIGYTPWVFGIPPVEHGVAWKQLFDPRGFDGKYGPTTAERRSPRFRFKSSDQCTWNGPMWPFATTETLLALAAYENEPTHSFMSKADYYKLFSRYVLAQHLTLPDGRVVDWIDEDRDADIDQWIAKTMLIEKNKQVGRGNYYNHSGFADPLITGMIGLRPRADNRVVVNPLVPEAQWRYFALDGLPYHGHLLTILWDKDGKRYGRGAGMQLLVDGVKVASRKALGELTWELK